MDKELYYVLNERLADLDHYQHVIVLVQCRGKAEIGYQTSTSHDWRHWSQGTKLDLRELREWLGDLQCWLKDESFLDLKLDWK